MPNITGSITDALEVSPAFGTVTIKPYGTDIRVEGSDVRLGVIKYDISELPAPLTLDAGSWTVTVSSRGNTFVGKSAHFDLQTDTSWGAIFEGLAQQPALTPGLVQEAQAAAAEAEMWASTAQGVQDTAVETLVTTEGTATKAALSAEFAPHSRSGARPVGQGELVFNARDYGAVANGTTDDAPAIQAAINAAGAVSGTVFIPTGTYRLNATLDLTAYDGIKIVGGGGVHESVTRLVYYGGGVAINAAGVRGLVLSDLSLFSGAAFTRLISLVGAGSSLAPVVLERVFLRGQSVAGGTLLHMSNTFNVKCDGVRFQWGSYQVFRDAAITPPGDEANAVSYINCYFDRPHVTSVLSPGAGVSFLGCAFEPKADGTLSSIRSDPGSFASDRGMSVVGCWFGDSTSTSSGAWISYRGDGFTASGNMFACGNGKGIELIGVDGIHVGGNTFFGSSGATGASGIAIAGTAPNGVLIDGNHYGANLLLKVDIGVVPLGGLIDDGQYKRIYGNFEPRGMLRHRGATVGFNDATPVGKRTLGAAATDAATTQTLANALRQALIDLGLGQP